MKKTEYHPESSYTFIEGSIADKALIDVVFAEQTPDIVVNLAV